MAGNTFGTIFTVTTFGESHGAAIGVIVDGCPAGMPLCSEDFTAAFNTARPSGSFETARREPNTPEILSGVFGGKTLGTPIAVLLRNADARPHDYEALKDIYRPGHADFAYEAKYRRRDWRGGGRASGREAAARIAAGVIAKKVLAHYSVPCPARPPVQDTPSYTLCTADGKLLDGTSAPERNLPQHGAGLPITIEISAVEIAGIPCKPLSAAAELPPEISRKLTAIKQAGDSAGALVQCTVRNVPAGLGEPVFDKLEAELAKAVLSIGSVKGIAFGAGFQLARMSGSEANALDKNHHGGIAGGISDGRDIVFQAVIKPVPSIAQEQLMETASGARIAYTIAGRHDVCLYRRVMPVIEAMTAIVLADMLLRQRAAQS